MAKTTLIKWSNSTHNPWIGCTKVGPGCINCYAEVSTPARALSVAWGQGAVRHRTAETTRKAPLTWNRTQPGSWVFCASLADWLDNEVPQEWRDELLDVIAATPNLRWQLCTKRLSNLPKMVPPGWFRANQHVGVLVTTVTQDEMERDVPRLLALKAEYGIKWVGLSVEPLLEAVTLRPEWSGLDWVICGGESAQGGAEARPFDLAWGQSLLDQGRAMDVPCFMKQIGSNPLLDGQPYRTRARHHSDPAGWPADLRVQQMPRVYDRERPADAALPLFSNP